NSLMPVFETAAKSFNIAPIPKPVHSDTDIETVIDSLGQEPSGALFVAPDTFMTNHRATSISLAARTLSAFGTKRFAQEVPMALPVKSPYCVLRLIISKYFTGRHHGATNAARRR